LEGASGGVRPAGSARGEAGGGGALRCHGESCGVDVHVLLHRRAGDGLGIGQEVRYGAVWTILPADVGPRGVPGAVAIRGGICERGAHRRGYREDHRGGARSAGGVGADLSESDKLASVSKVSDSRGTRTSNLSDSDKLAVAQALLPAASALMPTLMSDREQGSRRVSTRQARVPAPRNADLCRGLHGVERIEFGEVGLALGGHPAESV